MLSHFDVEVEREAWMLADPLEEPRHTLGLLVIGAPERMCEDGGAREELVAYVREAARAVSRELGAIPW